MLRLKIENIQNRKNNHMNRYYDVIFTMVEKYVIDIAKTNPDIKSCIYTIPTYIQGCPTIDNNLAIPYIINKLIENNLYAEDKFGMIYIDWSRPINSNSNRGINTVSLSDDIEPDNDNDNNNNDDFDILNLLNKKKTR